jgi:hypothetical protein
VDEPVRLDEATDTSPPVSWQVQQRVAGGGAEHASGIPISSIPLALPAVS